VNNHHKVAAIPEQMLTSLDACSYPNLGQIADMLERDQRLAPSDAQAMLEVPSSNFSGGIQIDGPAVFGSLVLFSIMISLSFGRIFGLDQYIAKTLKAWREERLERERWKVIEARKRLERQFDDEK